MSPAIRVSALSVLSTTHGRSRVFSDLEPSPLAERPNNTANFYADFTVRALRLTRVSGGHLDLLVDHVTKETINSVLSTY